MIEKTPITLDEFLIQSKVSEEIKGKAPEFVEVFIAGEKIPVVTGQLELGEGCESVVFVLEDDNISPDSFYYHDRVCNWFSELVSEGRVNLGTRICWRRGWEDETHPFDAVSTFSERDETKNMLRIY